ncbi:14097_t:CDS:2 [Entrophospora sp. SA101]|nr:11338_t:CDS:2 [Entrophospora sp. SA101]CAJ0830381.1 14097_t:CDS:2 [Entrophospora sp. SA101]
MSDINTEAFLKEVDALYNSQNKTRKEQADNWLQAFQKTSEAWSISNYLLREHQDPQVLIEARYFCARTLRQKITLDLHQLDSNARISLRDSLLELLYQYRSGPRNVITQLCLSIAALALQMQDWKNVTHQVAEFYGKNPETILCLLEFLKILPEEVYTNNRIPISDHEFRIRAKELLTDNANEVLQTLLIYLQNLGTSTEYQVKVFECLLSWIDSGDIPVTALESNPFLAISFEALQSDELYDIAVDLVCQIIHESGGIPESMTLIEQIYPRLLPLRESLKRAMLDEDDDKVRGYCRIFTQAGESYLQLIVQHSDAFQSIVESIAECTTYHDTEIVRITFYFWHMLADTLYEPRHADIKHKFKNIYSALVNVMIKHLHYPNDLSSWTAEKRDEFREFRHVMGDVLKDSCLIAGSQECLSKPYNILTSHISGNAINGCAAEWQEIEAPLFSLRAMGSEVEDEESVVLPQIMQLLQQLPNHPKIRYAATLVIARYSHWTRRHPEFIPFQLNFISSGIEHEEVSAASSLALKYLSKDCSGLLIEFLPQLHIFYLNVTNTLHGIDLFEVTEAVAYVIAAVQPSDLLKYLQMFCLPIAQKLHEFANKYTNGASSINDKEIREACDKLEQVSLIIRTIAERQEESNNAEVTNLQVHPSIAIIQELWPVIDLLLVHFGDNPQLSESICKCFKYCVVSYRVYFRPLLPELIERLVTTFDKTGLSCYLWVATKCVREHTDGEGTAATLALLSFVQRLSVSMFKFLSEKKLEDIPDVIEDYFRMLIAFVDCAPFTFSSSRILPTVVQAGLTSLTLEQHDALFSIITFFNKFLAFTVELKQQQQGGGSNNIRSGVLQSTNLSQNPPITPTTPTTTTQQSSESTTAVLLTLETLFNQFGLQLVSSMFKGLLYTFPRDLQPDCHEIIKSLARLFPLECQQWIIESAQQLQDANLTIDQKNMFIRDANIAIQEQDWNKLRIAINDFVAIFRRRNLGSRERRSRFDND